MFLTAIVRTNERNFDTAAREQTYRDKFDRLLLSHLGKQNEKHEHFRNMIDRLESMGIIATSFDNKTGQKWIALNVNQDEACIALKQNDKCAKAWS